MSNFRNGIDVDKWDYFARDSRNLGIDFTFDYRRYVYTSRVIKPKDDLHQICSRDKVHLIFFSKFGTKNI